MAKKSRLRRAQTRAFDELEKNPPRILAKTRKKSGKKAADKQRVAIALAKARRATRRKR